MARVDWSEHAVAQIDQIARYIEAFDPVAAAAIADRLFALGESLAHFPLRGRPGPLNTRALVTVRPYVLTYEVADGRVHVLDVRHGAREAFRRP